MSNYEPCGLSSADFARIAGSVQEAPVRLKFLKPAAFALPDSDTTNIDKIDNGTHHDPPNTAILNYEKIIYDDHAGRERTIVLHSVNLNNTDAVISVINHIEGTVDAISSVTSDGWSADYFFYVSRDMEFNPETNELAIMVKRQTGGSAAALFVINLNKYSQELTACNQLAENPDYRKCTIYEYTGTLAGYGMHFVRHYKRRWYCWIGDFTGGGFRKADFGYFDADGDWTSLWMQDLAHPSTLAPSFKFSLGAIIEGSGQYGDPMCVLAQPKTMEIDADGMMTLGMLPDGQTPKFGNEAMIVRIDLNTLHDMSNPATGVIDTANVSYTFSGSVTPGVKATDTITVTAEQAGVDRIDQCGIYEINCIYAISYAGSPVFNPYFYHFEYVETDVGAISLATSERFFVFSKNGQFTFGIAPPGAFTVTGGTATVSAILTVRKFPNSLVECLSVHSETPIVAIGDTDLPAVGDPDFAGGPDRAIAVDAAGVTTVPTHCHYSEQSGTYVFTITPPAGFITIRTPGIGMKHYLEADGLYDDYIRTLKPIGSDTFLVVSGFYNPNWNNVIQVFNADTNTLSAVADSYTMTYQAGVTHYAVSVGYSSIHSAIALATDNEIWIFRPDTTSDKWSRDVRVWWDGSQPDKDLYVSGDSLSITDFQFSDDRGMASATCSFTARGAGFLPWKKSTENEDYNNPGAYSPLLTYGTRIQIQRGVRQAGGAWKWLDEAQVVVTELPENLERGIVNIPVQCEGLAAHLFTKAIYEYFHEPTREQSDPEGDGWTLLYRILPTFPDAPADLKLGRDFGHYLNLSDEDPGLRTTDWISFPPPKVEIDGVETRAYQIDYRRGLVRFAINQCDPDPPYFQIPTTIDANFWHYIPGTNEIEDIIWCICTHPNDVGAEMGGAGLDEGYLTDTRTDDPLELSDDGSSATFPRNNLYSADEVVIKRDGVVWAASNYTLYLRTGIAEFGEPQTGHIFTSTYKHWTLQASGITAPPMQFTDRDDGTAIDCIERACRATFSFNYIFKARRDGKFESDYYIQKTTADITITDSHIILEKLIRDPADEDCYSAVISYGKYPEGELPNLALGIVPTELWTGSGFDWGHTWYGGPPYYYITDNNVYSQQSGGWGRDQLKWDVTIYIDNLGENGAPMFSIDLGELIEVDQIVFVRGEGRSNEGDGGHIQTQSIWASQDGAVWEKIIPEFQTPPAMTVNFKGGQDWPEGRKWQHFRINCHEIGWYRWKTGVDSQISFAEFQVYESEFIRGYAQLQDSDSGADLWDYNGILEKHGLLTLTARDGQADETLVSQELADADAAAILTEISRYVVTHNLSACPLPGVDILCTLNITNAILNTSLNFFIENRNFGTYEARDSIDGVYVP